MTFTRHPVFRLRLRTAMLLLLPAMMAPGAVRAEPQALPDVLTDRLGTAGGLCVVAGAGDLAAALELGRTGRFLVQVLDSDQARVDQARARIAEQGLYGLVSVDRVADGRLPYAENLVNVLIVAQPADQPGFMAEALRVVCPRGILLAPGKDQQAAWKAAGWETSVVTAGGKEWLAGRKPWPAEMDQWPHPRHAADGNAVSGDTLVGPPRRVRWVAGPSQEVSSVVSAGGRNYYGGVWARDAFNGLRLWQRTLTPSPAQGGFGFGKVAGSVRPVAGGDRLYAVTDGQLVAIDGVTGRVVREFPEAGTPTEVLHVDRTVLAIDRQSVRALDAATGALRWKHDAAEPQYTVAGDGAVFFLAGAARRGEKLAARCLDLDTGNVRWQNDDLPWLSKVRRLVCHGGYLACEVSTLADEKSGNSIHVIAAADGKLLWGRDFVPGMNHMKQSRAMFVGDRLWVLEHLKCVALDPRTGEEKAQYPAGHCHCFPPVATARYLFSGEMDMTDLASGKLDANRITKAACGRDAGWMPANGLVYVTPKHCVCWPMLRGYVAMAPARPGAEAARDPAEMDFPLEKGVDPPANPPGAAEDDWPCYRQNAWRSGSQRAAVAAELKTLWKAELGTGPYPAGSAPTPAKDAAGAKGGSSAAPANGPIAQDWQENPFVDGPLTPPVVAAGTVYVARPDAHEVVALDAAGGAVRWRYTANGRIDTPPTIHGGLCLFGTRTGWVYCLRADDGRLVWRLGAAPRDERIVAYGQVESPWPVAGSVLVVDGVAYFAAGRQSLADGGILVFAVEPPTGRTRWVRRLDTVPTTNFYACNALEFDCIDLMHQEGDAVTMSRWLFDRATGKMTVKAQEAFALLRTGGAGVMAPRSYWSYAPRHQPRISQGETPVRPLVVFRDDTLFGCLNDWRTVYRRDFNLAGGETFDRTWVTGWDQGENLRKKAGDVWQSERLARSAKWKAPALAESPADDRIAALALAGNSLLVAGAQGGLAVLSAEDGSRRSGAELPPPVWDGMAAAGRRVFVSTRDGRIVCLGQ